MTPADILTPRNTEHPFRLFFPLACLGAWVALLPWLALLLAPQYAGHFLSQPLCRRGFRRFSHDRAARVDG